jgi:hypothetical protein
MTPLDPSGDFARLADGLQAVGLIRRGRSGLLSVAHALRRSLSMREAAASNGQYTLTDVTWSLPKSECGAGPVLGDVILDADGNRWTVLAVAGRDLTGLWECTCRDLAIARGLNDVITIEQAVYSKGEGGAAVPAWHTLRTGVRARIQPVFSAVEAGPHSRSTVHRYRIVIAEELAVDHTERIRAADGTIYRIIGSTGAAGIGELQTIEAEPI